MFPWSHARHSGWANLVRNHQDLFIISALAVFKGRGACALAPPFHSSFKSHWLNPLSGSNLLARKATSVSEIRGKPSLPRGLLSGYFRSAACASRNLWLHCHSRFNGKRIMAKSDVMTPVAIPEQIKPVVGRHTPAAPNGDTQHWAHR